MTVRKLLRKLQEVLHTISVGSVVNMRPFFVKVPSNREKLECLCGVCFNTRVIFDALMKYVKFIGGKIFESITSYFVDKPECRQTPCGYLHRQCIKGDCSLCNGIQKPHEYVFPEDEKTVKFYQFLCVLTGKLTKKGKPQC